MAEIEKIIENEIANRGPEIIRSRKTTLLVVLIILPFLILFVFVFKSEVGKISSIVAALFCFSIYFYFYLNKKAKKELLAKGVEVDFSFYKHWANENYYQYRNDNLVSRLIDRGALSSEIQLNINLLKEYSDYFLKESKGIDIYEYVKIIGSLFLVFILPMWNQYLGLFVGKEEEFKLMMSDVFKFKSIILFTIIISSIVLFRFFFKEILESRKNRLRQISNNLLNIKWNEELKLKEEVIK